MRTVPRLRTKVVGESRTQQHFKNECDPNQIMKRFQQTGIITHVNQMPPSIGGVTGQTFTEAMFTVKAAEAEFMRLNSTIRAHFENSTSNYLDAIHDPSRVDELCEIGLLVKPEPEIVAPTVQEPEVPAPNP